MAWSWESIWGTKWQSRISEKKIPIFFISNFLAKNEVFTTFLQNYAIDFANFWSEGRNEGSEPSCQVSCRKKNFPPRYSSLKFRFSAKRANMGFKDRPISRERKTLWEIWFDILNQRKILFHKCLIRFFPASRLQGLIFTWKLLILTLKYVFFMVFRDFQPNYRSNTTKSWQYDSPKVS